MTNYSEPDFNTAKNVIDNALRKNEIITIYCDCLVNYEGRAYSKLERGGRVVTIKKDKTIIVHKPTGRNPVNWMKEGANIKTDHNEEALFVISESINPREHMIIKAEKIKLLIADDLQDNKEVIVTGTEADMAQMIYEKPYLISNEFKPVSLEEQTKYGFIDVMGHDGAGMLTIIECKRITAGLSAVQQLRRYVEKISKAKGTDKVEGIITAPNITKNALQMLNDWGYKYIKIEPPNRNTIEKTKQGKLGDYFLK